MNNILDEKQISNIKLCGKILATALREVENKVKPGISTFELDRVAEESIRRQGAVPSFKDYEVFGIGKYPATLCTSINCEVVHGIPKQDRILMEGDIISLDIGAKFEGVCTDMAVTVPVGEISTEAARLIKVTKECLDRGISEAIAGNKIGAIGAAVGAYAHKHNLGVVRDLVGHGIGEKPHMDPQIPNYGDKNSGPRIVEGMALAIEPMITSGGYDVQSEDDLWTVTTTDNSLAAHFEHTVIIENDLPTIVTEL